MSPGTKPQQTRALGDKQKTFAPPPQPQALSPSALHGCSHHWDPAPPPDQAAHAHDEAWLGHQSNNQDRGKYRRVMLLSLQPRRQHAVTIYCFPSAQKPRRQEQGPELSVCPAGTPRTLPTSSLSEHICPSPVFGLPKEGRGWCRSS